MSNTLHQNFIDGEIAIYCRTFVLWDSPSYGNCYSFNFDVNSLLKHVEEKPSKSVALPGPGHGLNLVFNIEQEHYGGITETEGVRWVFKSCQGKAKRLSKRLGRSAQFGARGKFCPPLSVLGEKSSALLPVKEI